MVNSIPGLIGAGITAKVGLGIMDRISPRRARRKKRR